MRPTHLALTAIAAIAIAAAVPAAAQDGERSGTFTGASDHVTTGTVSVTRSADGAQVVFGADFTFDGAPDPRVAFGSESGVAEDTIFAELQSDTGGQTYVVPAGIDPADHSHVYLWCQQFSVPLGLAPLN